MGDTRKPADLRDLSDDDLDLILRALDRAQSNAYLRTTQTAYRRLIRTIRAMKGRRHD